jgi:hypothetical protein
MTWIYFAIGFGFGSAFTLAASILFDPVRGRFWK